MNISPDMQEHPLFGWRTGREAHYGLKAWQVGLNERAFRAYKAGTQPIPKLVKLALIEQKRRDDALSDDDFEQLISDTREKML